MAGSKRFRSTKIGCAAFLVLLVGAVGVSGIGKDIANLWKNGALPALLFPGPKRQYNATNEANLKAIQTALLLYHESEGQFPQADGWMDAIQNRLKAYDLAPGEAEKKLMRPDFMGQPNQFGYALNRAVAGKYKDDVGGPETPLVYESKQRQRNASGEPKTDGDGIGITIDGRIRRFP